MSEDSVYTELRRIYCFQCNMRFSNNFLYSKHYAEVHGSSKTSVDRNVFACPFCDVVFRRKFCVTPHIATKHSEVRRCKCGIAFKSFDLLLTHIEVMHLEINVPETKIYNCDLCDGTFQRKKDLGTHMKTQHSDINSCTVCHKVLSRVENHDLDLEVGSNRESLSHAETPALICQHCGFTVKSRDRMLGHIRRSHPTVCETCAKSYTPKVCVKKHPKEKHKDGKKRSHINRNTKKESHKKTPAFLCPHCGVTYNLRNRFLRHIKSKHLQNEIVSCRICEKCYTRTRHVLKHLKNIHKVTGSNAESFVKTAK